MKIKNIKLSNWRSFDKCDKPQINDLRDFNVIIGANSSGKSNIACGIRFALGWGLDYGYERAGGNLDIRKEDFNNPKEEIEFDFQFADGSSLPPRKFQKLCIIFLF